MHLDPGVESRRRYYHCAWKSPILGSKLPDALTALGVKVYKKIRLKSLIPRPVFKPRRAFQYARTEASGWLLSEYI